MSTQRRSGGRAHRPLLTPGHSACLAVEGNSSERVVVATFAPGSVACKPFAPLLPYPHHIVQRGKRCPRFPHLLAG